MVWWASSRLMMHSAQMVFFRFRQAWTPPDLWPRMCAPFPVSGKHCTISMLLMFRGRQTKRNHCASECSQKPPSREWRRGSHEGLLQRSRGSTRHLTSSTKPHISILTPYGVITFLLWVGKVPTYTVASHEPHLSFTMRKFENASRRFREFRSRNTLRR